MFTSRLPGWPSCPPAQWPPRRSSDCNRNCVARVFPDATVELRDDAVRIPVVVGRRQLTDTKKRSDDCRARIKTGTRVLVDVMKVTPSASCQSSNTSGIIPTLYVLNAAVITKPHADRSEGLQSRRCRHFRDAPQEETRLSPFHYRRVYVVSSRSGWSSWRRGCGVRQQ